jgi:hypothetical protein
MVLERSASMQKVLPLSALLLLSACGDKDDTGPGESPSDSPVDTAGDTGPDTDPPTDPAVESCGDGSTGFIEQPELAVHVWADAAEGGDGSWARPFTELSDALEAVRLLDADKRIAVWAGEYSDNLLLSDGDGDGGTVIQGCGPDETIIDAEDPEAPVIAVSEAQDVELEGLCTRGGTRNIQIWSDATVFMASLRSSDSAEAGVLVHGEATLALIEDLEVDAPIPGDAGFGYGLAIQEGASAVVEGGAISGATAVGVFVDDATEISLSDFTVSDTVTDGDGAYGHGLQVQADTVQVTVEASSFVDNQGAGVFVLQGLDFVMSASSVTGTAAAAIPDSVETTGDGVVISRGEGNISPATFAASLEGNTIEGSARAGVLLDGVTASLTSNVLSGNGYGDDTALAQDSAVASGSDAVAELEEPLELNLMPLTAVDPGSF